MGLGLKTLIGFCFFGIGSCGSHGSSNTGGFIGFITANFLGSITGPLAAIITTVPDVLIETGLDLERLGRIFGGVNPYTR